MFRFCLDAGGLANAAEMTQCLDSHVDGFANGKALGKARLVLE